MTIVPGDSRNRIPSGGSFWSSSSGPTFLGRRRLMVRFGRGNVRRAVESGVLDVHVVRGRHHLQAPDEVILLARPDGEVRVGRRVVPGDLVAEDAIDRLLPDERHLRGGRRVAEVGPLVVRIGTRLPATVTRPVVASIADDGRLLVAARSSEMVVEPVRRLIVEEGH